jgi:predicted amidophosphoribosyltransferase
VSSRAAEKNDVTAAKGRASVRSVLEVIFPGRCLLCGEWLQPDGDHDSPLCAECGPTVPLLGGRRCERCGVELISEQGRCLRCRTADFGFDSNVSLFANTGPAQRLLAALKFGGRARIAAWFAVQAADVLGALGLSGAVLVPSPPRPGRREPDAVERVARVLEQSHGVDVRRILFRTSVVQQKSLDYEQRRDNLRGRIRFTPSAQGNALPSEVVLLDDVFTTGATLDACARALREGGCRGVRAVTLVIEE